MISLSLMISVSSGRPEVHIQRAGLSGAVKGGGWFGGSSYIPQQQDARPSQQ